MRRCAKLLALVIGLLVSAAGAAESGGSVAKSSESAELRKELRAMRTRMEQIQRQFDALLKRVELQSAMPRAAGAVATAGRSAPAGQNPAADAKSTPPLGVTPAGAPTPPASAQIATPIGAALKQLMPGPVKPSIPPPGYAGAGPQGVIVPGIQGVPKVFIPDIGGVGDFTLRQANLHQGDPRFNPADDKFQVRDTQLIFFSPIDPYTNAQISIDKPANGPFDIEEAFLVFTKLPYGLTLRMGQYRPAFGLINALDTFQLPMVNRPQALARYIGEDGLVEPGVNLTSYVPNPWDADLKLDLNVLSGNNPLAFNRNQGQNFDFAYMGTLTYARELFSSGAMTGGLSLAGGPGPGGQAYYADPFLQVQYAPNQSNILTWSIESLLAERQGVGDDGVKRGLYALFDYNFWLRYHAAFLIDMADRPNVPRGTEVGFSPLFTYFVSDNTRLRLQYTHTTGSGPERPEDAVFLQATFALGNLKPLE